MQAQEQRAATETARLQGVSAAADARAAELERREAAAAAGGQRQDARNALLLGLEPREQEVTRRERAVGTIEQAQRAGKAMRAKYERKKNELKGKLVRLEAQKAELTAREMLWREGTAEHESALTQERISLVF